MNRLSKHRSQVDCFTKIVNIQGIGEEIVVLRGERKIILNCIILVMTTRMLIRKRCHAWLSHMRELKRIE
jgi:hypothetical protein